MLFKDGAGFCPYHKRDSSFKIVHQVEFLTPEYHSSWGPQNVFDNEERRKAPAYTGLVVVECTYCHGAVALLEHHVKVPSKEVGGQETDKVWRSMVSPQEAPRELHESAPEKARNLYAEASTCQKTMAFRAAGVMYRATVEELVKDQGATGGSLYDKIDSLKGTLSSELVEDLHEARMLGNDSIHAGLTYSEEEVEDVAKLIEEAVLVLYVQPEEKRAMREARKARRDGSKT